MDKVERLETMMNEVPCPNCFDSRFKIKVTCDLSKDSFDYHAVCKFCKYKFFFTDDFQAMEEMWENVEESALEDGCPDCGTDMFHLEFLCDVLSNDCFFLVRCKDKNHYNRMYLKETNFHTH